MHNTRKFHASITVQRRITNQVNNLLFEWLLISFQLVKNTFYDITFAVKVDVVQWNCFEIFLISRYWQFPTTTHKHIWKISVELLNFENSSPSRNVLQTRVFPTSSCYRIRPITPVCGIYDNEMYSVVLNNNEDQRAGLVSPYICIFFSHMKTYQVKYKSVL